MNAVEIEEAVSALATAPFDAAEFPFAFLAAFGNKETTIKRLRTDSANTSDVPGGVLQRNKIHIAVCSEGQVRATLVALRASEKTIKGKVKFVLATDGIDFEAEDIDNGEPVTDSFTRLAHHFGFFLPLAGISTVSEIKNNPIDIKATSRLNKLYVELLNENKDWNSDARRQDLNQFMARLIFCFFAEDTGILPQNSFTTCMQQMTDSQSGNTHEVIAELFRAMDTPQVQRAAKGIKSWADKFPYVNGGLFTKQIDCPRFSRIARSYLLRAGELDWKQINPDIFGSMIQAVADDEERGELGMHYTSVPNILKVLGPLFLDELREQLEEAGDNARKLLNLRKRIASIRVFDPACGSGNFLVIAYIKMREIEAEAIRRRNDKAKSWMKLTNFYGIEIKSFAAEIARLALLIAEFQCNVRLIGHQAACLEVLPLHDTGQIVTGNALRLNWLNICPPLNRTPGEVVASIDVDAEGVGLDSTFICGNPPYKGGTEQTKEQKADLAIVFDQLTDSWKSLDYVSAWFMKLAEYARFTNAAGAFVSTNSICQGEQVARLWPIIFGTGQQIRFAHTSFKWANLAKDKAGVTVVIIGLGRNLQGQRLLFDEGVSGVTRRAVDHINAYLIPFCNVIVEAQGEPTSAVNRMINGNKPADGGNLIMDEDEADSLRNDHSAARFIRPFVGADDAIHGRLRYCLWIEDKDVDVATENPEIRARIEAVKAMRRQSTKALTRDGASSPHLFQQIRQRGNESSFLIPRHSSERRPFLPVAQQATGAIIADGAFAMLNPPLWNFALLVSRIHLVWISTVCGKIKTDFRYSNTLGWNTFPVPPLTENQKADLTRCAEDILLAREAHFPATIADLYDPETMPEDLRRAHDRNDETLERIYIGRRFKNDTERLEKLFDLYTKMTEVSADKAKAAKPAKASKAPKTTTPRKTGRRKEASQPS